ncbi:apoptosis facilitator Bcl-2-like protein 14 isoform X1 [Hemiscyllium ocellatum]|uniref:apoptosis facilitator Bcl-2-like protein 14 isoform X1 n=1 Tax=Hemiscyllium ocellatum TaxID=170820 RepID=UPI0029665963|nr:apoptosis facilitator Bcl-2-like protein 14 isoform X1 [Hemiscyllium ocellatum]XP_060695358.1 apoptosis facilitator Bcl-2-like protein 14 isoform X1 [Hemiscyllium ocellatum]XP_060695359.1 apoptosis facilitator Bcl-2-like protein 14 isoform X1 [Hemiscyllium ocellatum]
MGPSDAGEGSSMLDYSSTDDDSCEFRILMAYAQRTLPMAKASKTVKEEAHMPLVEESSGSASKVELRQTDKIQFDGKVKSPACKVKHRRKPLWKRIPCLRGETDKSDINLKEQGMKEEDKVECKSSHEFAIPDTTQQNSPLSVNDQVAEMLQEIMNSKMQKGTFRVLRSCSLEVDGAEDHQKAIDQIIAILTTEGDHINEEIKKDPQFSKLFGENSSFSIFKTIMDSVLEATLPAETNSEMESETDGTLKKIAFVVHATTRFAAAGHHPMARIMGFGAKYLQEHYDTWVMQNGGWEELIKAKNTN